MTGAIIWLVVWAILAVAGMSMVIWLVSLIGIGLAALFDALWIAPVFMFIGWLGGVGWLIFAAVQVVLQAVDVFHLATA